MPCPGDSRSAVPPRQFARRRPKPGSCDAIRRFESVLKEISKSTWPPAASPPRIYYQRTKVPLAARAPSPSFDAQDDPNAEADLAQYRSTFGLPACTTANGCFQKLNENGNASPLRCSRSRLGQRNRARYRDGERDLPGCKIILLEADQPTIEDWEKP